VPNSGVGAFSTGISAVGSSSLAIAIDTILLLGSEYLTTGKPQMTKS
jgi:hypothetical protein